MDASRLDSIDQRLEQLSRSLEEFRVHLQENTSSILTLQRMTSELLDIALSHQRALRIFQTEAEQDRVVMRENQVEIRRIWEYLLQERPNGHGSA
jgi:hypothetical protein